MKKVYYFTLEGVGLILSKIKSELIEEMYGAD